MKKIFLGSVAVLALAACEQQATNPAQPNDATDVTIVTETATPAAELGQWGIELADMDETVAPGDDFYRYVNGKWLDSFEIPAEFSNYGSFTVLFERSEARVKDIIEAAAAADAPEGSIEQKIGSFYNAYLDTDGIDAKGMAVTDEDMAWFDSLTTHNDIAKAFGRPDIATESPVGGYVEIDSKNPTQYIFYIGQSGLGLPDRDYYLEDSYADKQDAYKTYLEDMMTLAGLDNAAARAQAVYDLEKKLAEVHWERSKSRNRDLTYNLYTIDELNAYAPEFPWAIMMEASGLNTDKVVLRQNDAIQASAKIFAETPVDVWRDYLKVHYLSAHAAVLPSEVDEVDFNFYGKTLRGVTEQRARWKRGVAAVNGSLGEAVGQVYVEKYFPEESKAKMEELVSNLKTAFRKRLNELDWMSDETKAQALEKLNAFNTKIGYPDEWKDYSTLEIIAGDAFGNMKRANQWEWNDMIAKLGGPIDRNEWFMNPQTVNAYYSPTRNEIVFPAAILQAPFFDPNADDAVNYGGIGAVIGHEIGHGFDDQGRKSDGTGLLRDWWTEADTERFKVKTDKLGAQYAEYSPVEGKFVNPTLTMGENMGDLGGMSMAYEAYKLSLDGKEDEVKDGYTGDQRFFMAWAQVWKRKYREEELIRRLATDPHSPSQYRTNGIVRNMDAWYDAFDIPEDSEMYLAPEDRVQVW
ncbi:MAG: M13 family metallopeptidase [bacterium]